MALPLLGLLLGSGALAGAGLGQEWYLDRQGRQAQAGIDRLMGSAPEQLAADVAGPPRPGTGLMADPADPSKQLEFARGMMGLGWREKKVGTAMLDSIMGRASQAGLTREGWGFQAGQNALARAQSEAHFERTEERLNTQFGVTDTRNREQFEATRKDRGDEFAFRQLMDNQANARAWLENGRQAAAAARAAAQGNAPELPKLSANYEYVQLPGQAPGQPGQIVARPVRGTPDWIKGKDTVDRLAEIRGDIGQLKTSLTTHGTMMFGPVASHQRQLHNRIGEAVGVIGQLGTLQVGDLQRIYDQIPDPTGWGGKHTSVKTILSGLESFERNFTRKQDAANQTYRGWGLPASPSSGGVGSSGEPAGRDAPPAGSVPLGGGGERPGRRRGTRLMLPRQLMESE